MTDPVPQTISYPELLARFAPETPSIPVLRVVDGRTVEVYFPIWTTLAMLENRCQRIRKQFPRADLAVVLVTDIPRDRLFGDWATQAPEDTP